MADLKFPSNGNIDIWVVAANGIANPQAPTAAEINAGLRLTEAIAWDGTTFPGTTGSDDVDDRSLNDAGNATTRGFAQFEAGLNFFYPKDTAAAVTDDEKAYQFFKVPRVPCYLVTRVGQRTTGGAPTPAAAGDWVSVYYMIATTFAEDTEGDDSYKYAVGFLPQGILAVNTQVKNATPVTTVPATTAAVNVGDHLPVRATLGGKRANSVVDWSTSNAAVATVSPNGVITGVSAGTATITVAHAAASAPATITVTVT